MPPPKWPAWTVLIPLVCAQRRFLIYYSFTLYSTADILQEEDTSGSVGSRSNSIVSGASSSHLFPSVGVEAPLSSLASSSTEGRRSLSQTDSLIIDQQRDSVNAANRKSGSLDNATVIEIGACSSETTDHAIGLPICTDSIAAVPNGKSIKVLSCRCL